MIDIEVIVGSYQDGTVGILSPRAAPLQGENKIQYAERMCARVGMTFRQYAMSSTLPQSDTRNGWRWDGAKVSEDGPEALEAIKATRTKEFQAEGSARIQTVTGEPREAAYNSARATQLVDKKANTPQGLTPEEEAELQALNDGFDNVKAVKDAERGAIAAVENANSVQAVRQVTANWPL